MQQTIPEHSGDVARRDDDMPVAAAVVTALPATVAGDGVETDRWPTVSVVIPVRNEAARLERAVASILAQDYPLPFDVCLAVAPSYDDTARVANRLAAEHPRVSVVRNPSGVTPAGLNAAIRATNGEVVVRVDAHAELSPGYVRRAVETMRRTGAVNVGGMQVPKPETAFERHVATVTTSWLGTGGARYRVGGVEGPVDTVYLGVFDRAAGAAVGWFDESLVRNQDYELNIRLREAGGVVWFDPELRVAYRPRNSWRSLARQYYHYGYWKAQVLRRYPRSVRMRQVVPVAALGAEVAALAAVVGLRGRRRRRVGGIVLAVAGALVIVRPLAIALTMQVAWSVGLVVGSARPPRGSARHARTRAPRTPRAAAARHDPQRRPATVQPDRRRPRAAVAPGNPADLAL